MRPCSPEADDPSAATRTFPGVRVVPIGLIYRREASKFQVPPDRGLPNKQATKRVGASYRGASFAQPQERGPGQQHQTSFSLSLPLVRTACCVTPPVRSCFHDAFVSERGSPSQRRSSWYSARPFSFRVYWHLGGVHPGSAMAVLAKVTATFSVHSGGSLECDLSVPIVTLFAMGGRRWEILGLRSMSDC